MESRVRQARQRLAAERGYCETICECNQYSGLGAGAIKVSNQNSAPGPDSLPYAVWASTPELSADTRFALHARSLNTDAPTRTTLSTMCFIEKTAGDGRPGASDSAASLRPLSLKDTADKLCAAAMSRALSCVLPEWACAFQRGGVPGRRLLDSVIRVDAAARAASLASRREPTLPALVLFDIKAAFPSVSIAFLKSILAAMQLHTPLQQAIMSG